MTQGKPGMPNPDRLPCFHGDPADRLIVATSLVLQQPVATADNAIHEWFEQHQDQAHLLLPL